MALMGGESLPQTIDTARMSADFVVSTISRDRQGDHVVPSGCLETLGDYAKNPRVFFNHNTGGGLFGGGGGLPIGSARDPLTREFTLWVEEERIVSRCFFHCLTQESRDVWELVAAGELNAASIGFYPVLGEVIEQESGPQDRSLVTFEPSGFIFHKWNLLEWSVVAIPANPEALRSRLSGRWGERASPSVRKALAPFYPDTRPSWSFNKRTKTPMADLVAPPQQGTDDEERASPAATEAEKGECQCLLFDTSSFTDQEEITQWCEANEFSAELMMPPSGEGDQYWYAVQFDADECDAETVEKQELDMGVFGVFCKRVKNDEDGEGEDGNSGAVEGDDAVIENAVKDVKTIKGPGVGALAGKKPPSKDEDEDPRKPGMSEKPKPTGDDVQNPSAADKPGDKPHKEPDGDEQVPQGAEPDEVPYGVSFMRNFVTMHETMCGDLDKAVKLLEHQQVKRFAEKMQKGLTKSLSKAKAFAAKTYPEHGFKAGEGDVYDESEDEGDGEAPDKDKEKEKEDKEKSLLERIEKLLEAQRNQHDHNLSWLNQDENAEARSLLENQRRIEDLWYSLTGESL